MPTKTADPLDLPAPVAAYFVADATGAEAVAQCFTDGAVVIDERQESGFIVRVYFDGQLQDTRAIPPELLTSFPNPDQLSPSPAGSP